MKNNSSSFTITQDHEIIPPKKGKAYPIPKKEWEYLKEKIKKIGDIINFYHTAGALLMGFSGSAFLNILMCDFPKNTDKSVSSKFILCLSLAICTLIVGGICCFFGIQQRKIQSVSSEDVIKQMEIIEDRFSFAKETQESDA